MMIIDAHTHIFPDDLAARAVAALSARAGISAQTDGTATGLRASLQRAGIDRAILMPVATKPSQVRAINAWTIGLTRDFPDQLLGFGALHPAQDDWAAEIDYLRAHGIRGVKLHPDYQETFVDDARCLPLLLALREAGMAVLLHAGVDIGLPPPVHCTPERLARMLDAVPGLTVIAAHMGGYLLWDDVRQHLIGRDLYLDTSYSLDDLGATAMTEMILAHGPERILFGTDSPWKDQAAEVAGLRALPLPADAIQAILGGNVTRLLSPA